MRYMMGCDGDMGYGIYLISGTRDALIILSMITVKLPVSVNDPQLRIVFVTELKRLLKATAASRTVSRAALSPVSAASSPNGYPTMKPRSCVSVRSLFARSGACQVRASASSSADGTLSARVRERWYSSQRELGKNPVVQEPEVW